MSSKMPALSPRNLFFIVLGACLVLLVLWYFVRFQSRQLQIQDLSSQIESADTQLSDLQAKQARLPELRRSVAELQSKQAAFTQALPATTRMGQVITDVRENVAAAGGAITDLGVQPSQEANLPPGVQAINLNLGLEGRFAELFRSLRSVETMGRFSKVNNVAMTLPAPNAVDPKLTGNVTMTVYTFDPAAASAAGAATAPGAGSAPAAPAPATGGKS